jgi:hypothetical protein
MENETASRDGGKVAHLFANARLITFPAWELIVMIAEGGVDQLEGLHISAYL